MKKKIIQAIAGSMAASMILSGCGIQWSMKDTEEEATEEASVEASDDEADEADSEDSEEEADAEDSSEEEEEEEEDTEAAVPGEWESSELMEGEALTEAELAEFEEFLSQEDTYGFVYSAYKTPEDINFREVFYNGAELETSDYPQEAYDAYVAKFEDEIDGDIVAIKGEDIRNLIEKRTGIKDYDVSKMGYTYLEEYDMSFHIVSDCNYAEAVCYEGVKNGDMIQLIMYGQSYIFNDNRIRVTLKATGDSSAPYQFVSCRELWEENAEDVVKAKNYDTGETVTCAFKMSRTGMDCWVINDYIVSMTVYPYYANSEDLSLTNYDEVIDVGFCDVDEDGFDDMITVLSNGKGTLTVVNKGYKSEWSKEPLFGIGKSKVSNWISDNVDEMTVENVIDFIMDNVEEFDSYYDY